MKWMTFIPMPLRSLLIVILFIKMLFIWYQLPFIQITSTSEMPPHKKSPSIERSLSLSSRANRVIEDQQHIPHLSQSSKHHADLFLHH